MEKKLEEISWSPAWETGIATIDGSHRELVSLTNRLIRSINEEVCPATMSEIFFALIHYAEDHLIREEILLRNARFPALEKHQEQHAAFIDKIRSLREKFSAGDTGVCHDLYDFLSAWLDEHVRHADPEIPEYLKGKGIS